MKEKIKTFVAKNRLTLLIAFCIVGTLFTQPLTVYRGDSNYFWCQSHSFNPFGSGRAFAEFLVEPDQDIEIIGFTDTSSIAANGSVGWNDGNREFRATTEQIYADRLENEPNLTPRVQILCGVQEGICKHSPLYMELTGIGNAVNFNAAADYTGYLAFIFKKNGFVVGSELYKLYTIDGKWWVCIKPLVIMEYPLGGGSELAVRNELQQIAWLDRLITHNGAFDRWVTPSTDDPVWQEWKPPYSSAYYPQEIE